MRIPLVICIFWLSMSSNVIALAKRGSLAASQGIQCPAGFQNVHGSCYLVSLTPTTWNAAKVICQSHNAHLADFSTRYEIVPVMLDAVIPKSSSFKYRDPKVWIDAVYSPSKQLWIWSHDSSLVNYRYFTQLAHSPGTTERCVFAIVNTGINPWAHEFDVDCDNSYLPLCEVKPI